MLIASSIVKQVAGDQGQRAVIPWTNILANVATENIAANRRPKLLRNRASQFDVEIRYAARRVHHIGLRQGSGGTSFDAVRAGAAAVGGGNIHSQFQTRENHPQKKP